MTYWHEKGERVVFVTLVGVDGSFSRSPGAQLAVSETGKTCGFITNGCLEEELKSRALYLLKEQRNECVRYGRGSKYIDIVLPCGSGIDLYFDQSFDMSLVYESAKLYDARQPFKILTNLETGVSELSVLRGNHQLNARTELEGNLFSRVYKPKPKLMIYGDSRAMAAFVQLAISTNFDVQAFSTNEETARCIDTVYNTVSCIHVSKQDFKPYIEPDQWTAAVLLFHDHGVELPILKKLLKSNCFYIGAQGSVRTHEARVALLQSEGFSDEDINRLNGPMGLIPRTKSPTELAVSTFAEIVTYAQKANIPC